MFITDASGLMWKKQKQTKKDDMDSCLVKLLCERLSYRTFAIVGVVDDDLTSSFKEVPYELLTTS
jgi:hypothetical protein